MFISLAWSFLLNFRLYFQSPTLCLQCISNLTCPNRIPVFFPLNLFFSKPPLIPWMTPSFFFFFFLTPSFLSYSIQNHGILLFSFFHNPYSTSQQFLSDLLKKKKSFPKSDHFVLTLLLGAGPSQRCPSTLLLFFIFFDWARS